MTALCGIRCDGPNCGAELYRTTTQQLSTRPAREKAKTLGWHKVPGNGYTRDICPACWAAGHR